MKIIKEHAIQEAALLLALCGWLTWYSLDGYEKAFNKDWTQSPYLFPIVLAVILGVLALVLVGQGVKNLRNGQKKVEADAVKENGAAIRVVVTVGMTLIYYAVLRFVSMPYLACTIGSITLRLSTFELATLVLLFAMMYYMGVRKKAILVWVPIGATVFLSVMFRSMLHVILP